MTRILAAALASSPRWPLAAPAHASRASDALKRELGPGRQGRRARRDGPGALRRRRRAADRDGRGASARRRRRAGFLARHGDAFGGGDLRRIDVEPAAPPCASSSASTASPSSAASSSSTSTRDGDVVSASGELLPGSVGPHAARHRRGRPRRRRSRRSPRSAGCPPSGSTATTPRAVDLRRPAARRPRPAAADARLAPRRRGRQRAGDRRPRARSTPQRGTWRCASTRSSTRKDRQVCDAANTALRTSRARAPVAQRGRGRDRRRGGRLRLRLRRRHLRLLRRHFGRDSLDDDGHDAASTRSATAPARPVPVRERVLERPADGLRRRLRRGRRRGRPRARRTASPTSAPTSSTTTNRARSTSRCPTSSASSSTSTNGAGTDTAAHALAGRRGHARIGRDPRHGEPAGRSPTPDRDDQPELLRRRRGRPGRRAHQQRREQQGRVPDDRRRHVQRPHASPGIGIAKVARIYYEVLTTMLTSAQRLRRPRERAARRRATTSSARPASRPPTAPRCATRWRRSR